MRTLMRRLLQLKHPRRLLVCPRLSSRCLGGELDVLLVGLVVLDRADPGVCPPVINGINACMDPPATLCDAPDAELSSAR